VTSFCVRCGKEGPTYESLCVDCFLANNRFTKVPDHVDLVQCYHCKEFLLRGKWQRQGLEEAIRESARDGLEVRRGSDVAKVRMEVQEADPRNFHVELHVALEHADLRMEEQQHTIVRLKNGVCPRCSKIMGSYYESIIQIRGRDRKLTDRQKQHILDELQGRVMEAQADNREMFISKVVEVPGGFDAYLSAISLGKSISKELADRYGAEVKESSTLVTQKEGKDVYRVTYLVRLPAYLRGEIILFKDKPHQVSSITSTTTKLVNLKNHEPVNLPNSELREAKVIGKYEDILEAVILTEGPKEMQVLHPKSYKTTDLKKPQTFHTAGDTVHVFLYEEEIYLLPK
jgi:nonsense-mediated mRNA decay protein 3